jgi:hypothetical protein
MKATLLAVFVLGACSGQHVQAEDNNAVLAALQNSSWHGSFTSGPAGVPTCHGSIDVRFFGMRKEPFARGAQTVSYQHHAYFSLATPFAPICGSLGASMSAVNVAGCEKLALTKKTVEGGHSVSIPVRTLIARADGLAVSTPTCVEENGRGVIKRMEFPVRTLEFTGPKKQSLRLTLGLGAIVSTYELQRVSR